MAARGRIHVLRIVANGEFVVQAADAASAQVMAEAMGKIDGLRIEANWPRRRGGAKFPTIRLTTERRSTR